MVARAVGLLIYLMCMVLVIMHPSMWPIASFIAIGVNIYIMLRYRPQGDYDD